MTSGSIESLDSIDLGRRLILIERRWFGFLIHLLPGPIGSASERLGLPRPSWDPLKDSCGAFAEAPC